jgi:hypothetical protein
MKHILLKTKYWLLIVSLSLVNLFSITPVLAAACPAPNPDYGSATTTQTISSVGTYRVWSRIMTGVASTDNSYSLEIDGANCYVVGDNTSIPANTWTWVDYQNGSTTSKIDVSLSAASHTFKMIGREDGVKVDRIIVTTDTACVPTGTGDNCATATPPPPPPPGPTPTPTPTPPGTIQIGETTILAATDSGNANQILATQTTLSTTATLQSMSFYVDTAAGQLRLGVYDATGPSGGPGAKKAETAAFTPVTGWNTQAVVTPVSLAAGTYWLAYLPSSNSLTFRDAGNGNTKTMAFTFGAMPATFSTTPGSCTCHWSLYANLSSGSATPVVGDINSDHIVNSIDYSLLNAKWFTNDAATDLNHDGLVNAIDYSILNANWFKTW